MPRFKIGDQVERIGALIPPYLRSGVIIRVFPNEDGVDEFTEYEVNFDDKDSTMLFETQLRLVKAAKDLV